VDTKLADTNLDARQYAWVPSAEQLEAANVTRLARLLGCEDFAALHRVSVEEPDRFWRTVRDDIAIPLSRDWDEVLDDSRGKEWTTWFTGARLNLANACVHRWAGERPDEEAAVWLAEDGARQALTWSELSSAVTRFAEALVALGVRAGDAVGMYLPMSPHAAVVSHACAHIGAIQVPIFSGFAAPAIAARLADAGAKVLVTADATLRRGTTVPLKQIADEALAEAPSVEHVVVWNRLGVDAPMTPGRDHDWDELVAGSPGTLPAAELESEAPYLLAYTSGTTGRPKGALHVHGGFLLSIAREGAYQADLRAGDRVLFATDMGWIMGPWTVVGAGACGAAVVYLEGAPDYPPDRIWSAVESERVTMLGVSPTLVRALIPHGEPAAELSSLRAVTTTGEPWNRGPYDWLNEHVCGAGRIPIVNISGGTEVGACFLSVSLLEPTKPCSLGFPALGQDMDVFDDAGRHLRGEVG
jgi:acetyl-CoA synthetase